MNAYGEAIEQTSRDVAPWYVIPSDRRWYRKLAVAEVVADALKGLDPEFPEPAVGLGDIVIPK